MSIVGRGPQQHSAGAGHAIGLVGPAPAEAESWLGELRLQPKISRSHACTFFLAVFFFYGLFAGPYFLQTYLLSTFLHLEPLLGWQVGADARTGGVIASILAAPLLGIACNRIGRRTAFACGLVLMGASIILLPFSASTRGMVSITTLNIVASTPGVIMTIVIVGDYVVNENRGYANGLVSFFGGLGIVLLGSCVGKMPDLLSGAPWATADGKGEGYVTYGVVAVCSLATAVGVSCGLAPREAQDHQEGNRSVVEQLRSEGLVVTDPGIVLGCLAAVVGRADMTVASLFIPQWCVHSLLQQTAAEFGLSPDQLPEEQVAAVMQTGLARASTCVGVLGLASMVAGPIFGRLLDSADRIAVLVSCLVVSTVGYVLLGAQDNPFDIPISSLCFWVGFSNAGTNLAAKVFVQQHAPPRSLCTAAGFLVMFGSIGQAVNIYVGGQLFYRWKMQGPFLLMAFGNFLVALISIAMYKHIRLPRCTAAGITYSDVTRPL